MGDPKAEDALYNLMDREFRFQNDLAELNPEENKTQRRQLIREYIKEVLSEPNLPTVHFNCDWEWFNSETPLTTDHLIGRISVLDFFTYCCSN